MQTDRVFPHQYTYQDGYMHPGEGPGLAGAKGMGEGGTIGAPATVLSALNDALRQVARLAAPQPAPAEAQGPPPVAQTAPYRFRGYERWRDQEGYPAVKPPWGTIVAIDVATATCRATSNANPNAIGSSQPKKARARIR